MSEILSDRELSQPRLLPWVVLAAMLHGAVVAAIFLFGRAAAARPAHLPVVSVRVVQQRPQPRPPARGQQQPTPVSAAPTAVPTPAPEPQPTAPIADRPSEDAMAAPSSRTTPVPTPASSAAQGTASGRGLSLGEGAGQQAPGIPADFHFTYYIERMLALIESRWYKPAAPAGTRARVRFRILRDGRVERIELEESSGNPSFDRAALRAMFAANPLPPLPPAYRQPSLTVHLAFTE